MLAWDYDASVAAPHIDKVVNAADLTPAIAPGGLITLFGEQMSPVNLATKEIPVPTALGGQLPDCEWTSGADAVRFARARSMRRCRLRRSAM